MKKLIILAMLLTGCANGQQFVRNMGAAMDGAQGIQRPAPTYTPVVQKRTDYQCFQGCLQAGYQYGLCQSRCSY